VERRLTSPLKDTWTNRKSASCFQAGRGRSRVVIDVPATWLGAIESDRGAGVELACELAHRVAERGAFTGVHLIPGVRYRETAARLEEPDRAR